MENCWGKDGRVWTSSNSKIKALFYFILLYRTFLSSTAGLKGCGGQVATKGHTTVRMVLRRSWKRKDHETDTIIRAL